MLIPAEDGDTTDTLREKYYASIDGEAFGGNVADYREKVNAITGVGGVKVYPVWNGGGTVKLTVIASDLHRTEHRAYQQGTDRHRPRTEPR